MSQQQQFLNYETFRANMTTEEILDWFQRSLNRYPEPADIYKVAKDFFQLGAYSRAYTCLGQYMKTPGAIVQGRHLLAYSLLYLGEKRKALGEFKRCVREGMSEDWQLVVELTIEVDEEELLKQHYQETLPEPFEMTMMEDTPETPNVIEGTTYQPISVNDPIVEEEEEADKEAQPEH
jgi:tetratricopeptide (TPR) repeat protein